MKNEFDFKCLIELIYYLDSIDMSITNNVALDSFSSIKNETKNFFHYYNLCLNDVNYLHDNIVRRINPLDLPIRFVNNRDLFYGQFMPIYSKKNIMFKEILLNQNFSKISSTILAHEITHTQVLNHYSILDYMNYELLSLFIDKLSSFYHNSHSDLFLINEYYRLKILKQALNLLRNYELDKNQLKNVLMMIESILKTEHLFSNFIDGEKNDRDTILNNIQNVFDGNIFIEDMLNDLSIKFDNSIENFYISNNIEFGKRISK